ncbi:MAG: dephospho-CoA kinase [Candidatus Raymondbacteria bacterium RifOxyA12_full_50_37]|uniref:Dephospho-CoA kinase n=1 Tax=Candidatus Raymondbacteria bacterium RIFOXYD12_FULL_49_13 TaxID=1817890 RepID=A0A1F7F007_UNCRA|nr:MAG: dephospho-CoA kinase [Candidatus Raymondbacteria bacterium RifOxyA12_full_50_37]OGJ92978.1 MAG: dephospho-CoA kinase [Candidatus Raymondbacteria bacterium RIFOXYA2_FULL_49_16]OGJ99892.1 MAG: dephospho-CoA kinase [Candidatus Raymondbacteria bacterium RIFOXYD12_FULL_49_13]OGP40774.1 MAG: dephospho-CoA kinase [Candidatus Raymondbacteria bacterium RIFOXYB2_FULL_49_35]
MVIGITGNVGSGKSTVARLIQEQTGGKVVDADEIGHHLLATNPDIQRQVQLAFGPEILDGPGRISRKQLGAYVFADPERLTVLNQIFYQPLVYEVRLEITKALRVFTTVILDAALIVEWGVQKDLDTLITVTAAPLVRLQRLMEQRRLLKEEAVERIEAQAPESLKIEAANIVITNEGSLDELRVQVEAAMANLGFARREAE